MAGKILTTKYFDTNDAIVNMNSTLIQNSFYSYNDKKGLAVKYYNINDDLSTLDPGSKLAYTDIGSNSPIRFNVINGMYLYQFNKAELNLENGDYGLESSPITGESYIIPNTIVPRDGDFFEVNHIKDSTWLFKVNDVQRDTLENGANVYKISWNLDRTTNREILQNVVKVFKYVDTMAGTNLKAVVEEEKYTVAAHLDDLSITFVKYFKELFYNKYVQTFIYKWYTEHNMYDPFAIEFIIRNKLIDTQDDYLYVDHKMHVPSSFSIDYDKTLFRAFEERDIKKLCCAKKASQADYIDDMTSIFSTRYEAYFSLNYNVLLEENGPLNPRGIIQIMDEDFAERIVKNIKYPLNCEYSYRNIIIKYFNKENILLSDVENINKIDLNSVKDIFYDCLFLIFCLDYYTKYLLS